jgi:glutathione peroxidase
MKINNLLLSFFCLFLANFSIAQKSVHDFTVKDINGKTVKLANYKGKVLLIVNTASKCGFTPQYKELEAFYEKNKSKGFEILGFPANDFMGQEPGSDQEIQQFCSTKFNVTFPMFSKISVKGKNSAPLYKFLTQKKENGQLEAPVKWNFQKFLVDKKR